MRHRLWGIAPPIGLALASSAVVVSSADSRIVAPALARASAARPGQSPTGTSGQSMPPSLTSETVLARSSPAMSPAVPTLAELGQWRLAAQARVLRHEKLLEDASGAPVPGGFPKRFVHTEGRADGGATPIVNESALGAFHESLRQLSAGQLAGGKVRILAYGASHTQADLYTGYLRSYLQQRFGDAGPGFVNVRKLDLWDRKLDVKVNSNGFGLQRIRGRRGGTPGFFGLLGATATATAGQASAELELDARLTTTLPMTVELHYMGTPDGGELEVAFDGTVRTRFSTRAQAHEARFTSIDAPSGLSRLSLRKLGAGEVRVFGVAIERAAPGVVVDTLGIQGTKMIDWLEADESVWRAAIQQRKPHLVTLAYGTNEFTNRSLTLTQYRAELAQVFERLKRAVPDASCLLIGPGDLGLARAEPGRTRLSAIIEIQREYALRYGCGFWNTFEFMGGRGAMARWVGANPPMASTDHTHLNRRGYVLMGMRLADALLRPLDHP